MTRIGGTATTFGSLGQTSTLGGITSTAGSNLGAATKTLGATGTNTQYTGYEAAVYQAAASYLQAKTTGQTNQWMAKKSGR